MDKIIDLKGLNGLYLFADKFQDNDLFRELIISLNISIKYFLFYIYLFMKYLF